MTSQLWSLWTFPVSVEAPQLKHPRPLSVCDFKSGVKMEPHPSDYLWDYWWPEGEAKIWIYHLKPDKEKQQKCSATSSVILVFIWNNGQGMINLHIYHYVPLQQDPQTDGRRGGVVVLYFFVVVCSHLRLFVVILRLCDHFTSLCGCFAHLFHSFASLLVILCQFIVALWPFVVVLCVFVVVSVALWLLCVF